MALEATAIMERSLPVPMICAEATGIEKGAILKLTSPMTAATATGDTDIVAGIAQSEFIGGQGHTSISVYRDGLFTCYAGAAGVTAGSAVITDVATGAANELVNADVNSENIVGTALTTATDGNTFILDLNPRGLNLA